MLFPQLHMTVWNTNPLSDFMRYTHYSRLFYKTKHNLTTISFILPCVLLSKVSDISLWEERRWEIQRLVMRTHLHLFSKLAYTVKLKDMTISIFWNRNLKKVKKRTSRFHFMKKYKSSQSLPISDKNKILKATKHIRFSSSFWACCYNIETSSSSTHPSDNKSTIALHISSWKMLFVSMWEAYDT